MADEIPKEKAPETPAAPDLAALAAELLKQHGGDQGRALMAVMGERDKFRDEAAETRKRLPKDGHVVLDPEAAKAWAAYQAYGPPEVIGKALEDGKTAATERDDLKFQAHTAAVAGLMKWKPGVLADRVKASGVETVIKEEADPKAPTGAKLKVPHVKLEGDKTQPLAEYAAAHWGDYLPALSAEPAKVETPRGSPPSNGHTPARPAVPSTDQPRRSLVR